MSFEDNSGFKKLKDAFARFAAKHDPSQLQPKLVKTASAAAKAALTEVEREFPRESVEKFVDDAYQLLAGQDVTDGLTEMVQSLDLSQIEDGLNTVVSRLKDPQTSQMLASSFKSLSGQMEFGEFKLQMKTMLGGSKMPPLVEGFFDKMMSDLEVFYDESKEMSTKEIADRIADYADSIPTDFLSQQAYGAMQFINPETLTMVVSQLTANLPSSKQAGDLYDYGMNKARQQIDVLADQFSKPSRKPSANDDQKPAAKSQPKPARRKKGNDDGFKF
jgi:urease gamma subunit